MGILNRSAMLNKIMMREIPTPNEDGGQVRRAVKGLRVDPYVVKGLE